VFIPASREERIAGCSMATRGGAEARLCASAASRSGEGCCCSAASALRLRPGGIVQFVELVGTAPRLHQGGFLEAVAFKTRKSRFAMTAKTPT
jgi:hypothetical protein